MRFGRQEGYDRVVYEFSGTGPADYLVQYVEEPIAEGSGDVVQVAGDAYLQVLVTALAYPEGDEQPPPDVPASALEGTAVAESSALFAGFEGMGQVFVGIRGGQRPFRVTALREPTRLVIDVAR
ncbi:MAG: AMIN-like domain-containing (lipo)protein [Phycicoccus sp.]